MPTRTSRIGFRYFVAKASSGMHFRAFSMPTSGLRMHFRARETRCKHFPVSSRSASVHYLAVA